MQLQIRTNVISDYFTLQIPRARRNRAKYLGRSEGKLSFFSKLFIERLELTDKILCMYGIFRNILYFDKNLTSPRTFYISNLTSSRSCDPKPFVLCSCKAVPGCQDIIEICSSQSLLDLRYLIFISTFREKKNAEKIQGNVLFVPSLSHSCCRLRPNPTHTNTQTQLRARPQLQPALMAQFFERCFASYWLRLVFPRSSL